MKLKKTGEYFKFIYSIIIILILTIASLFPGLLSKKNIKNKTLDFLPPNKGINKLILYNTEENPVVIDKIYLELIESAAPAKRDNKYIHVASESVLLDSEIVIFKIEELNDVVKTENKKWSLLKIDLKIVSQNQQILEVSLNNSEKVAIRKIGDDCYSLTLSDGSCGSTLSDGFSGSNNFLKNLKVHSVLGSMQNGYDLLTRLVYGTKIIMQIVLFSILISVPLGLIIGLIRAYKTNFISKILDEIVNFFNSISIIFIAMLFVMFIDRRIIYIALALSLVQWVEVERIIYERVKNITQQDFIASARLFGKSHLKIITSEILPLLWNDILFSFVFLAKRVILIESCLSVIDYSVKEPVTSWGEIIASHKDDFFAGRGVWVFTFTILAMLMTIFAFQFMEDLIKKRG